MPLRNVVSCLACTATLLSWASLVPGAEPRDKRACEGALKSGQERERAGRLRAARESFQSCARATCGARVSQACAAKATKLESDIPSIVPAATDEQGEPRVDVEVRVDGEVLASRLDGHALEVDPGLHELSFQRGGEVFGRQKILVLQGQRNRAIPVSVPPSLDDIQTRAVVAAAAPVPKDEPPPAPPKPAAAPPAAVAPEAPPAPGGRSVLPYILGGVGLAGVGAGALLTYWGRKDNDALAACSPNCAPSSVTHIRTLYVAADIAFAAGGAALVGSVLWLALGRPKEDARRSAYTVDVQPTRSGAALSLSGAF